MNTKNFNKTAKNVSKNTQKFKRYLNKGVKSTINKEQDLIQDLKTEIASELGIIQKFKKNGFKVVAPKIEELIDKYESAVKNFKK